MYCPHMARICWRLNACQRVHLWNPSQENRKVTVDKKRHARTVAAITWSGKQWRESSWSNWLPRDKSRYWMVWETCIENSIKLGSLDNNQCDQWGSCIQKSIHESRAFLRPCSNLQAMHRDAGPHFTSKSKLVWMLEATWSNLADFRASQNLPSFFNILEYFWI